MVHVSWLVKGCQVSGGSSYQPHFYNINTVPGFLGDHQIQARVGFKGNKFCWGAWRDTVTINCLMCLFYLSFASRVTANYCSHDFDVHKDFVLKLQMCITGSGLGHWCVMLFPSGWFLFWISRGPKRSGSPRADLKALLQDTVIHI